MTSPSSKDPILVRWPTDPTMTPAAEYSCTCNPMGSLEKLPLLHAIIDRPRGSFIGRVLTISCQIIISLSIVLLPKRILERIVTVLQCFDCIGFLLIFCVEALFPALNRLIWGEVWQRPSAICERSCAFSASRRRSSASKSSQSLGVYCLTAVCTFKQ